VGLEWGGDSRETSTSLLMAVFFRVAALAFALPRSALVHHPRLPWWMCCHGNAQRDDEEVGFN
jgi:hypothetical protein